jgi:hypothetical protein
VCHNRMVRVGRVRNIFHAWKMPIRACAS